MPDRWLISRWRHRGRSPTVGHLVDVFPVHICEQWITACGLVLPTSSVQLMDKSPRKLNRCTNCQRAHLKRERSRKTGGLKAIMGKWPGDETDEQVQEALEEIS